MVRLAQTMHLSCTDTNTVSKWTKIEFDMTHITLEFHRVRPKWLPSLWYVQPNFAPILCQDLHYLQMDWNELPLEPRHLVVPLGASKTILEPMVRLTQAIHLSCTNTNTVSKQAKRWFHMTHTTEEIHWVRTKTISKPMVHSNQTATYLASRLALHPNGPKRASTWASSPSSTIGSVQNNYWAYGTFGATCAPILHQLKHRLQMEILDDPHHLGVPSSASKMISEPMACSAQTVHLFVVKISTTSKRTETSFHLGLVTKV
jgi:hypothetical protein